jgi:hypothetical protein
MAPLVRAKLAKFNENRMRWTIKDGDGIVQRIVEFGAVQHEKDLDKWRGRPHDLIIFDECSEFTEFMFVFLQGWNRSTDPTQRCRVLATSNPPSNEIGMWMIERYRLWLDPREGDQPAKPGELRWFTTIKGKDVECEDGEPFTLDGVEYRPRSRTFIPAKLGDNQYLRDTTYRATIMALPEPLRSQLLNGDFLAGREDHEWQVIPTRWIEEAQKRWSAKRPAVLGMDDIVYPYTAMGVDPAQGGKDRCVFARVVEHPGGIYVDEPVVYEGVEVPTEVHVTEKIEKEMAVSGGQSYTIIDSDGLGMPIYGRLAAKKLSVRPFLGGQQTLKRDRSGRLQFANKRAAAWWHVRELLDPANEHNVALPPDRALRDELATLRWKVMAGNVIALEPKDDAKERLGRSPDLADAVVYALWRDPAWTAELTRGKAGVMKTVKGSVAQPTSRLNTPFGRTA